MLDGMCCDGGGHRISAPVAVGAVDDYAYKYAFICVYVDVWITRPAVTNPPMTMRDHRHLAIRDLDLDIYETP